MLHSFRSTSAQFSIDAVDDEFRVDCTAHWASARLQSGSCSALPADRLASGHTFDLLLQSLIIGIERLSDQNQLFHQMLHVPAANGETAGRKLNRVG